MVAVVSIYVLLAAAQAPTSGAAWLEQARIAYQKAQFAEARFAAGKALELDPRSAGAELVLALVDTRESNFNGAQGHFARVLEIDPGNVSAHYHLGVIELLAKRPASALPHFLAVRKSNATDVAALMGILECQLALNDPGAVAETARTLNALIGSDVATLNRLAGTLVSHGYYAPAIPVLRRLRDAQPRSFDAAYNLSLACLRAGELDEAAAVLLPWLGRTGNAQAFNLLGAIREQERRYPDAKRAFEQAAQLAPASEDFRIDYASVLVESGSFDEAAAVFLTAVRDFPKSLRARLGLGSAYYLGGKYDLAARALLDAVPLAPDAAPTYALLGRTFESVPAMQDDIKRAFDSYLQRQPRDPVAYARFGEMLTLAGDLERAKQSLRRALEMDSRLAEAYVQLGAILQREGNSAGAAKNYERAVELAPEQPSAHYRLATLYQKLGRTDDSRRELQLFQQLKSQEAARERELVMRALAGTK